MSDVKYGVIELRAILLRVEHDVDVDGRFFRARPIDIMGRAKLTIGHDLCTISVAVKVSGSRKKPFEISADGETPETAASALIDSLDAWAKVLV